MSVSVRPINGNGSVDVFNNAMYWGWRTVGLFQTRNARPGSDWDEMFHRAQTSKRGANQWRRKGISTGGRLCVKKIEIKSAESKVDIFRLVSPSGARKNDRVKRGSKQLGRSPENF